MGHSITTFIRGQYEGGGCKKMPVFVHAQVIKSVKAGGRGVKKWQYSVHVVVECPLINYGSLNIY